MTQDNVEERQPLAAVLPGLGIHRLPEQWEPVEAFVLIKCRDEDGDQSWVYRTTGPPNREELLGALTVQAELLRRELVADWEDEPDT